MKRVLVMLSLLSVVLGLIACGIGEDNTIVNDTGEAMLEDTVWVLESYGEAGNLKAMLADTDITIEFKSEEDKFDGSGGCNSYFGGYETDKNELTINFPIGSTAMSCGEQIDQQEHEYLELLQTTDTFQIQDGKLTISSSGNKVLVFVGK